MIEVKNLNKFFGSNHAVDDVAFKVGKGEILGFLGPNGAGKSTTMRMLTGFIPPSSGTAVIGGCDIIDDSIEARAQIGYLPENAPVYPDMSITAYLDFCARVRGFSGQERKRRVGEALEKCFLKDVRFQSIGTLSKGYKQRVCFAQSILHDPEYLIMDEPTDGLDPNQKHEVRMMIKAMSASKVIILSTHILDEVDAICTRAIIIAKGKIVADASPGELKTKSSNHGAVLMTLGNTDPQELLECLKNIDGVKSVQVLEEDSPAIDAELKTDLKIRAFPENTFTPIGERIMNTLSSNQYDVKTLFVEQGRLDDVFRKITLP